MKLSLLPKRLFSRPLGWVLCMLLVSAIPLQIHAQELKVALSSPPTSLDPHFYNLGPNNTVAHHIFEALTEMDANSRPMPGLAESWRLINNLTWEFKLRKGVKFHDASELTADDVIWSLDRPATIVGSPSKFDLFTKAIINKKVIDPYTIRLTTKEPYPLILADLSNVQIVSKKATQGLSSEDFNSGKGVVGTGPYKFAKYLKDDRIELERHTAYWGKTPGNWSKITLRFIPNDATRLAALLAGDIQAMANVPTADLARVKADPNLNLVSKVSHRLIYLYLDTVRDQSPFVTDKDGKPLNKNPLKDVRVRQAISMAIQREAIKDRIMEGLAEPTNNMVSSVIFGHNPALKVVKFDSAAAKKLLTDAGYPNGFGITLHTPNNRYVNDEKISQTVAQMLAKIGISTKVEGMPMSIYSSRGAKAEFSMGLLGWGATTGEASGTLRATAACVDLDKGYGTFNWLKYCNPQVNQMLSTAINTVDDKVRLKLLQDTAAIVVADAGIIPLHHQVSTWAMKKNINYVPRTDEYTLAYQFSQK